MKQFNLEEYLKNPNRKIITRDGKSARIICVNRISEDYPIVVLIRNKDKEVIECYTKDGKFLENNIHNRDLFFAPEKKSGWINLYKSGNNVIFGSNRPYNSEELAKDNIMRAFDYITTIKIEWEE